jgi:uncharacterized cupin superfamily protein
MSTPPSRSLVRAGERGPEQSFSHPYNPRSEIHGVMLARMTGLTRTGVNLARVPPGKESFVYHVHHGEEEWMYVLSGRGVAEVGGEEHAIGPGDFLGFAPGGPAHQIRNEGTEDLVYLSGGENRAVEVADFPRLQRRIVRYGKGQWDFAVYPMDAEVPLFAKRGGEGGGGGPSR